MENLGVDDDEPRVASVSFSRLVAWNFSSDGEGTFFCKNCKLGNIKKSGTSGNLIKHCSRSSCFGFTYRNVKDPRHNKDLQPIFRAYHRHQTRIRQGNMHFKASISPQAKKINAWIELIVKCNLPLSVVENEVFRKHAKPDGVSRKTIRKYIIKLADVVRLIIRDVIGKGNCVADGWTCSGVHYNGIYHIWPTLQKSTGNIVIKKALLSLSPMLDERSYGAKSYSDSLRATYDLYGSVEELVVCLTLDNTNTNPAMARLLNVPMIGAYCHRLNLATKRWIEEAFGGELMDELEVIHAVMLRASTLKGRGALKEHTPYVPELRNKTRWTGYQAMALKYDKIHSALEKTGDYTHLREEDQQEVEVEGSSKKKRIKPTLMRGYELDTFRKDKLPLLAELRDWFKAIQSSKIDLAFARSAFESIRNSPSLKGHCDEFEERLQDDHELVVSPMFEQAVVKILNKESEHLLPGEQEAARCLLKSKWKHLYPKKRKAPDDKSSDDDEDAAPLSGPRAFMRRMNKEKNVAGAPLESVYVTDLSWVHPTTVIVEQLFSRCRHVLTHSRRRLLPRLFEAIVYLKENAEYWSLDTVQQMVAGKWDDRLGMVYESDEESDGEDMDW